MTLGSICDGIGGWCLAAARAGIEPVWSSEIDKHCMTITRRHFPNTLQLGDLNKITDAPKVDIVTAGTPCQSLSIAGRREGLKGESGLFFGAIKLVRRIRPEFFVWENVPGAFSSSGGRDFQTVLEEILEERVPLPRHWSNAGLVDGRKCQVAWRILDAQYFGVPQRRKRIFLVADFAGRRAGKILFEREGVSRDIETGEGKGQDVATRTRSNIACTIYDNHWKDARIKELGAVAPTVSAMYGTGGLNTPLVSYCIQGNTIDRQLQNGANGKGFLKEISFTLNTIDRHAVSCGIVRRLTPLECERLMGLPDNFTEGISDAQRYKAIGNGMAQNIADWILKRIKEAENHDDI